MIKQELVDWYIPEELKQHEEDIRKIVSLDSVENIGDLQTRLYFQQESQLNWRELMKEFSEYNGDPNNWYGWWLENYFEGVAPQRIPFGRILLDVKVGDFSIIYNIREFYPKGKVSRYVLEDIISNFAFGFQWELESALIMIQKPTIDHLKHQLFILSKRCSTRERGNLIEKCDMLDMHTREVCEYMTILTNSGLIDEYKDRILNDESTPEYLREALDKQLQNT